MQTTTQTQDLHIVIAALGGKTDRALIGHTAVSAPLTWIKAQELWDRLDKERRAGVRVTGNGVRYPSHILHYAVRGISDPRWASLVSRGYANAVGRDGRPSQYGDNGKVKAAKAWAKEFGYQGRSGGWIYDTSGKPFVQGWGSFAEYLRRNGRIGQGSDGLWYVLDRELVA
jgi:hypothetical protein